MRVLLVDDERLYRRELSRLLTELGHAVMTFSGSIELMNHGTELDFDLFIIDLMLREDAGGCVLAEKLMRDHPTTPLVVISGLPQYQFADVEGHRHFQFLSKPFGRTEFMQAVAGAVPDADRRGVAMHDPGRRDQDGPSRIDARCHHRNGSRRSDRSAGSMQDGSR